MEIAVACSGTELAGVDWPDQPASIPAQLHHEPGFLLHSTPLSLPVFFTRVNMQWVDGKIRSHTLLC